MMCGPSLLTVRVNVPTLFRLALAGSLAGGMTVGTKRTCYGEATAKVVTSIVQHGPKGTAAEFSTPSDG